MMGGQEVFQGIQGGFSTPLAFMESNWNFEIKRPMEAPKEVQEVQKEFRGYKGVSISTVSQELGCYYIRLFDH